MRELTLPAGRRRRANRPRRGGVTLELILTLPIWLIFILAAVEFGQLLSNIQQLSLASRVGASEASQTVLTGTTGGDPVPPDIVDIVEKQLLAAHIVGPGGVTQCRVILEHNVDGAYVLMNSAGATCPCTPPDVALLPNTTPATPYVRVTVCVPYDRVAPNVLNLCGFDFSSRLVRQSTTFRYELGDAFP